VTQGAVTARWAGALFELAQEQGALDAVHKDVERLARAVAEPELRASLASARPSPESERAQLASLVAGFHPLTQNFVGLLFDRGRQPVLLGLGEAFRRRVLQSRGAVEGVVESARPFDAGELAKLAQALGRVLGKEVLLSNRIAPHVVGGVRVIVDNRLLDYSVRGRLAGLRRRLLDARLAPAAPASPA
jgi:F-type H+-transporting ATPase subunit delta